MLKFIKNIAIFGLKVLAVAYLFALLEEVLNKIIARISCVIKRISFVEQENQKMEQYYKLNGIQCSYCFKWYPMSFTTCPLCNKNLSMLSTVNKRLEIENDSKGK